MSIKHYLRLALVSSFVFLQSCEQDEAVLESQNKPSLDSESFQLGGVTADFLPSIRVINNQAFVSFINTSISASTFEWSIPGSSVESSTLRNPSVIYTQNGTFDVILVANGRGTSDTITQQVVISGIQGGNQNADTQIQQSTEINARFTARVRNIGNQAQVTLNNRSVNATSFQWSFPGGSPETSTERNPVVSYPRNGLFEITLVASNNGVSDSTTQNITINSIPNQQAAPAQNIAPIQNITPVQNTAPIQNVAPVQQVNNVRARFFASVRRRNGQSIVSFRNRSRNATSFQWTFEGGSPSTSSERNPTVTFSGSGPRTITLTASNGEFSNTSTSTLSL